MWSKRLQRFAVPLRRLVRRFTIRKPCWICDKCGWRERHEAEAKCWKCAKGEMNFRRHRWKIGISRRGTLSGWWYGQRFRSDGNLLYAVHHRNLVVVAWKMWRSR